MCIRDSVNSLSQLIFSANDGINGQELWKSDGSTANTSMIKDINPTGSSDPRNITSVSYTHLDVYKRQLESSPMRRLEHQSPTVVCVFSMLMEHLRCLDGLA